MKRKGVDVSPDLVGSFIAYPYRISLTEERHAGLRGLIDTGFASVATIGYTGFLVGPPLLGWIAEPASLRVSMAIVAVLCGTVILLAPSMRQRPRSASTTRQPTPAS